MIEGFHELSKLTMQYAFSLDLNSFKVDLSRSTTSSD